MYGLAKAANQSLEEIEKKYNDAYTPKGFETKEYTREVRPGTEKKDDMKFWGGLGALTGGAAGASLINEGAPTGRQFRNAGLAALAGGGVGALGAGVFGGKKPLTETTSYKSPVYSPEQEDLQSQFWDEGYDDKIIDLFGEQVKNTGDYKGPAFNQVLEYPLDENAAQLVQKYPRLLEAMKKDNRRDRGGILFNFQDNLDAYKDDPETQALLYKALERQLDNNEFVGWKGQWGKDNLLNYMAEGS